MEKLILILGPMKSGKSLELIKFFSPLKFSRKRFLLYQPFKNVRDKEVSSRTGLAMESKKIKSLSEIDISLDVVGIDEIHMFPAWQVKFIESLLENKKEVIISGLDLDYKGEMFNTIKKLLELGPDDIIYKRAVCEICKNERAKFTQIVDLFGNPILEGLESVVPDNGKYSYRAVCRKHFLKK